MRAKNTNKASETNKTSETSGTNKPLRGQQLALYCIDCQKPTLFKATNPDYIKRGEAECICDTCKKTQYGEITKGYGGEIGVTVTYCYSASIEIEVTMQGWLRTGETHGVSVRASYRGRGYEKDPLFAERSSTLIGCLESGYMIKTLTHAAIEDLKKRVMQDLEQQFNFLKVADRPYKSFLMRGQR